ncbi:hypothetical protein OUZ56_033101 [Daphnia magna]|uniref:Uncharacterized protein n=1 Tax=Daphnia magna TaxID=35525 RepID=A0ABR0BA78_9CRUS|nr:hypothetical protein OUZ56_033101 [Daphnia magna]
MASGFSAVGPMATAAPITFEGGSAAPNLCTDVRPLASSSRKISRPCVTTAIPSLVARTNAGTPSGRGRQKRPSRVRFYGGRGGGRQACTTARPSRSTSQSRRLAAATARRASRCTLHGVHRRSGLRR